MTISKRDYIDGVLRVMNELKWDDALGSVFAGADTTHVSDHIEAGFADAWRLAVDLLPRYYFASSNFKGGKPEHDKYSGVGYILLPDDFYRLHTFKLRGWQRAVYDAYPETDRMAGVQANEFTRGNICRPVCVYCEHAAEGRKLLRYYSLPKGMAAHVESARYIPLVSKLEDSIELDEKLVAPLQCLNGSVVYQVLEKPDAAKTLVEMASHMANMRDL